MYFLYYWLVKDFKYTTKIIDNKNREVDQFKFWKRKTQNNISKKSVKSKFQYPKNLKIMEYSKHIIVFLESKNIKNTKSEFTKTFLVAKSIQNLK